ncbi:hypothetical protein QCA50_011418 [Cerrena zonata]|uniref:Protein kinase domain-containing protein n=1 Tax=Cerrena zonata TaxID=2478898 RepID=A0AAW0FXC1_9APHY
MPTLSTLAMQTRKAGLRLLTSIVGMLHSLLTIHTFRTSKGTGNDNVASETEYLEGITAQRALDVIQKFLDDNPLAITGDGDAISSGAIMLATAVKLSQQSRKLPTSFKLPIKVKPFSIPRRGGSHTDIFLNRYRGNKVAVKRVRTYTSDWGLSPEEKEAVRHDIFVACLQWRQLRHQNILPLHGIIGLAGAAYVIPWRERGNIRYYINNASPEPDTSQRMKWMSDIANGLLFLHKNHRFHGNLRSEKILISDDGVAQLTDLEMSSFTKYWSEHRIQGKYLGIRWMAPEVLKGANRSPSSDVFSFGLVCIEIFTGNVPFPQVICTEACRQMMNGERPDRPETMPDECWHLVKQCLDVRSLSQTYHGYVRSPINASVSIESGEVGSLG